MPALSMLRSPLFLDEALMNIRQPLLACVATVLLCGGAAAAEPVAIVKPASFNDTPVSEGLLRVEIRAKSVVVLSEAP
jgi:hypothetical protein